MSMLVEHEIEVESLKRRIAKLESEKKALLAVRAELQEVVRVVCTTPIREVS